MQNTTYKTQNEGLSTRNAQLQIENDSLLSELRLVKGDYMALQSELNEARDYYHQLDLSAVKMGHRCEVSCCQTLCYLHNRRITCKSVIQRVNQSIYQTINLSINQ